MMYLKSFTKCPKKGGGSKGPSPHPPLYAYVHTYARFLVLLPVKHDMVSPFPNTHAPIFIKSHNISDSRLPFSSFSQLLVVLLFTQKKRPEMRHRPQTGHTPVQANNLRWRGAVFLLDEVVCRPLKIFLSVIPSVFPSVRLRYILEHVSK